MIDINQLIIGVPNLDPHPFGWCWRCLYARWPQSKAATSRSFWAECCTFELPRKAQTRLVLHWDRIGMWMWYGMVFQSATSCPQCFLGSTTKPRPLWVCANPPTFSHSLKFSSDGGQQQQRHWGPACRCIVNHPRHLVYCISGIESIHMIVGA